MKIDYCYHTHTTRCSHAYGTEEEYILEAIKNGLKVIGFTDHAFLPNINQPYIRGDASLLDEYVSTIRELKKKYEDQIEILVGFEAEYLEEYVDYYKELLASGKIDYLIQGQHYYLKDNELKRYFAVNDNHELLELYLTHIIEGMKSGIYTYIAHPDLFAAGLTDWDDFAISLTRRLFEAAVKYDVPLEFNLGGLRFPYEKYYPGKTSLRYPSLDFWNIAKEYPIKVFIGPDAHTPDKVHDEKEIEFAEKTLKELGITPQTRITKRQII